MSFLQLSDVCLKFGAHEILKNVTLNLSRQSRAALVGANGCGKSTLMKTAAGFTETDSGTRTIQKNCRIVYLPQSGIVHGGTTLEQEADKAFAEGYRIHAEAEQTAERLKEPDLDEKIQAQLLEHYQKLTDFLNNSKWHFRSTQTEQVLCGLGFEKSDFGRRVEEFSGGWQMRIALAKVLLQNPDILLLDEPTNYLDIEARTWLKAFLLNFSGGFLLVSHDRYFLDTCITEVYELFNAELRRYAGNFSYYEKIRQNETESLIAQYELQQEKIRKTEDFIRRFRYNAAKAAQVQERIKQLEKLPRIEIPESLKKIHFSFPPAPHSGRIVLTLEKLGKTYAGFREGQHCAHTVLRNIDLTVEKGERLVVTGRNGAGKTTLLRILAQEDTSYEGTVQSGAHVCIGYFSQDSAEKINGNISVIDMLEKEAPLDLVPKLRDMLAAFLFRSDDIYKAVGVLSGGEKSRLALLRLLLRPVNLLILDEPTNHLDIYSKDALLAALHDFGGTVIFISHDRSFTQSLATRILELEAGQYRLYPGPYDYYLEQKAKNPITAVSPAEKAEAISPRAPEAGNGIAVPDIPLSYEEQKKLQAMRRKLEKEERRLMEAVGQKETHKAELEAELAKPEIYSDIRKSSNLQKQIEALSAEIEDLSAAWEDAVYKLEEFLKS